LPITPHASPATTGKLSPNERRIAEWLENEAKLKREAVFGLLCSPIIEQIQTSVLGLGVKERAPLIPRTRDAFAELFKAHHKRDPTVAEKYYLFTAALGVLDPSFLTTFEVAEAAQLELAIDQLFASWKVETDKNFQTQMGRSLLKAESAIELGDILGYMPRGAETDRMWIRKQVEVGQAYNKLHIPLG
jgi:hypothetical protein